jgi:hypothetical protein
MRGRVARGPLALFLVVFVNGVVSFELIRIEPQLLRLEHGDEKVLALRIVSLYELLVDLIDHLLQLVIREIDLEEKRAVHLEATVMKIDAADAPRAAVDREDLARLGADGALET